MENTILNDNVKKNLLNEARNIIAVNQDANYENALAVNQTLQLYVNELINSILGFLTLLRAQYEDNKRILTKRTQGKKKCAKRSPLLKGGMFFFKGNMFFKDAKGRSCPNTPDYDHRYNVEQERFPMDFSLRARHSWTVHDKVGLIQGIKNQIIGHMNWNNKMNNFNQYKQIKLHELKLINLMKNVSDNFQIDWNEISKASLNHRHSPTSCQAMWEGYMHPNLIRTPWTTNEDELLLEAAIKCNYEDWEMIAKKVSQRSGLQCFIRYQTKLCNYVPNQNRKWNSEMDRRLLNVIDKCKMNDVIDWTAVNTYFPNVAKSTLICRYTYTLDPTISHKPFSREEDILLITAVAECGGQFFNMPRNLFPNRSVTQLRSHYYNTIVNRANRKSWSVEDDERLMDFVAENGLSSWMLCSAMLGNHSRTSCRTRYYTICRFLKKHPKATIEELPRKSLRNKSDEITLNSWPGVLNDLNTLANDETTEESKNSVNAKKKKQVSYVERLRRFQRMAYEYFKYAYNLKLDSNNITSVPTDLTLYMISVALKRQPNLIQRKTLNLFPKSIRGYYAQKLNNMVGRTKIPTEYLLMPNWSTAMGFRALCIQVSTWRYNSKYSCDHHHAAVKIFRQRLRVLFYFTALLSRLDPNDIEYLNDSLKMGRNLTVAAAEDAKISKQATDIELITMSPTSVSLSDIQSEELDSTLIADDVFKEIESELFEGFEKKKRARKRKYEHTW